MRHNEFWLLLVLAERAASSPVPIGEREYDRESYEEKVGALNRRQEK